MAFKTNVSLIYEGKEIAKEVAPWLEALQWTDYLGGKADTLTLTLNNASGLWASDWLPQAQDQIKASIVSENGQGGRETLFLGTFRVDRLSFSGPPSILRLEAQSGAPNSPLRMQKRSKKWESEKLSSVLSTVARQARLSSFFEASDVTISAYQNQETDSAFLSRIAADYGYSLKIFEDKIVILDPENLKEQTLTIEAGKSPLISWSFEMKAFSSVSSARVKYKDPRTGTDFDAFFTDEALFKVPDEIEVYDYETGKITKEKGVLPTAGTSFFDKALEEESEYTFVGPIQDQEEAEKKAKAIVKSSAARRREASLVLKGNPSLVAGQALVLKGFGHFDGPYLIEEATHTVDNGGHRVQAKLRGQ